MKEIAIYVEGGGDTAQQRAELRNGLDQPLDGPKEAARAERVAGMEEKPTLTLTP